MDIAVKRFEQLSLSELYSILRLRAEVFVVEQDCPYQDLDGIDKDAVHVFVEEDGSVISYLRVFTREDGKGQIGRVVTSMEHRGKGISLSILKEGVRIAKDELSVREVVLHSQTYAMGFYAKVGFVPVGEEFLEDGIPHKEMTLLL